MVYYITSVAFPARETFLKEAIITESALEYDSKVENITSDSDIEKFSSDGVVQKKRVSQ